MKGIRQGTVVYKEMLDKAKANKKRHPVVILSSNDEIEKNDIIYGVVASHTAAKLPDRDGCNVHLPHVPGSKSRAPFTRETAAVCNWIVEVKQSEIQPDEIAGTLQLKHLLPVMEKVDELRRKRDPR